MDQTAHRQAMQAAARAWRTASRSPQAVFDLDDLRQEALLIAWRWIEDNAPYYELGYADNVAPRLHVHLQSRLIDRMRSIGDMRRSWVGGAVRYRLDVPLRLDRPLTDDSGATFGDVIADPESEVPFDQIEDADVIRDVFESWDGPARHAEATWLAAHGHTLASIGEAYGVSEARISQVRTAFLDSARRRLAA